MSNSSYSCLRFDPAGHYRDGAGSKKIHSTIREGHTFASHHNGSFSSSTSIFDHLPTFTTLSSIIFHFSSASSGKISRYNHDRRRNDTAAIPCHSSSRQGNVRDSYCANPHRHTVVLRTPATSPPRRIPLHSAPNPCPSCVQQTPTEAPSWLVVVMFESRPGEEAYRRSHSLGCLEGK